LSKLYAISAIVGIFWGVIAITLIFFPEIISTENKLPITKIDAPAGGYENKNIQFSSTGSNDPDGSIEQYIWDFGDGDIGRNEATVYHEFNEWGTYHVTLKVYDNDGGDGTTIHTIQISKPLGNVISRDIVRTP